MPRIDPNQLLKCLSVLLSPSGGVKTKDEVQRLASLMTKFSKKLVSKCIYVLILKSTEADLLDMFMTAGGWDLTFNWLSDGIDGKNWPLVAELVELLLLCPVDIERLRGNNCPKVIKSLSKDPSATERVRLLACSVVDQWLTIVKGACEASNVSVAPTTEPSTSQVAENGLTESSNDSTTPKGVYKITIRDGKNLLAKVVGTDRAISQDEGSIDSPENESTTTEEPVTKVNDDPVAKEALPPKKFAEVKKQSLKRKNDRRQSPEPGKKNAKEKDKKKVPAEKKPRLDLKPRGRERKTEKIVKEKTVDEKSQEDKDKQNILKLITPSIGNLGKIPKKTKDDKKSSLVKSPVDPKKPYLKDPKKYNISIETRKGGEDRPKTVKTFNSKFRSTGLEEPPPPPKSSKKKEEVLERKSVKRPSPVQETPVPEKRLKEEEKPEKVLAVVPPALPKPKVTGLQESDVFADALTAANPVKDTKKRKRRLSAGNSPSDPKKECISPVGKVEDKDGKEALKPVLKFYQDTLVTSEDKVDPKEEKKPEDEKAKEETSTSEETISEENVTDTLSKEELEDEVAKAEKAIDQVLKLEEKKNVEREKNRLPKGVLVYVKKYKTIKKSVSWKSDNDLESIQYFELDETERVNVTKPFMDMKQMERINERMLFSRKLVSEDIMEEKTAWRPLIAVDIGGDLVVSGKSSIEKDIQRARERTTLQAIYFNRSLIPDSPAEPDLEIHAATEPAIIPLKDQTGNPDSVISYKDRPWPDPKGYLPGTPGSPPQNISPPPDVVQQQLMHGMPPGNMYPQQFAPQPMQPYIPSLMSTQWMGGDENMMVPGPQGGNDPMMMASMAPAMHHGLLPPPDMYHMGGGPPPHPDFMAPPFPMGGPPPPGMYSGGPANYPPHQDPNQRHQRPWYRNQNTGGGSSGNGGGGTWRHPTKNGGWSQNNKMCKFYLKKGICRQNNCTFRHGSNKGNIR